jgi:hypothetical protein
MEAARSAFRRSLDVARQLHETVGDTPQILHGLSMLLNNVGKFENALGNSEAAHAAFSESLDITRRLNHAFPGDPRFRRDLARVGALIEQP